MRVHWPEAQAIRRRRLRFPKRFTQKHLRIWLEITTATHAFGQKERRAANKRKRVAEADGEDEDEEEDSENTAPNPGAAAAGTVQPLAGDESPQGAWPCYARARSSGLVRLCGGRCDRF